MDGVRVYIPSDLDKEERWSRLDNGVEHCRRIVYIMDGDGLKTIYAIDFS